MQFYGHEVAINTAARLAPSYAFSQGGNCELCWALNTPSGRI